MENLKYNVYWHFKLKRSNGRALKALKIIESYRGKINPKFRKLSDEYAKEVHYINGKFCTPRSKVIDPENVKEHIFKGYDKAVYKLENSKRGKGVFILDKNNFDPSIYQSSEYGNGVFQKFIQQHPFFSEFANNSVATIRVTTVSDKLGNIYAKAAYIRFGRTKDTHIMSNSAVSVSIDIGTGELYPKGYMNWIEIDSHPDSNISFQQKTIPHFNKCGFNC